MSEHGWKWTKAPYWRDPDGRHWSLPTGWTRIEAEAAAVTYGRGWSVVDLAVRVAS